VELARDRGERLWAAQCSRVAQRAMARESICLCGWRDEVGEKGMRPLKMWTERGWGDGEQTASKRGCARKRKPFGKNT
jgi:hypothetical protein